jgi:hypothetical protein
VRITRDSRQHLSPAWSTDGSALAFTTIDETAGTRVEMVRLRQNAEPTTLTRAAAAPRVRWIAPDVVAVGGHWGPELNVEVRAFRIGGTGPLWTLPAGKDEFGTMFDVSRDGSFLVASRGRREGNIWVLEAAGRPF